MDILWPLIGLVGALLMRAGFAMHGAGMVRAKNAGGTLMRYLCDMCLALLAYWAIGLAIEAGGNAVLGLRLRSLLGWDGTLPIGAFFGFGAILVATAIVPGVLAERARFWPSLWPSLLLGGFIVPVARIWVGAGGWLARLGFLDTGGAASLHLTGALCAAAGAWVVGARSGKFHRDGSSSAIPGHNLPLALGGVALLLAGWVPFVVTSTLATSVATQNLAAVSRALLNIPLAGAAGGLAAVIFSQIRYYKPDIHLASAGVLGALVSISAGPAAVGMPGAVLIGGIGGLLVAFSLLAFDVWLRMDDPAGGVAIHGVGAIWGLIATPLVASGISFGQRFALLGTQMLGIAVISALTLALSIGLWALLEKVMRISAGEADEFDGLDLAEHDIGAYPDFQQTMIKSYHLREM